MVIDRHCKALLADPGSYIDRRAAGRLLRTLLGSKDACR